MHGVLRVPAHVWIIVLAVALAAPVRSFGTPEFPREPFTQAFEVTAYYSPKPQQCCYVRGGVRADKTLNGDGVRTADGTPVRPGIIAAPARYPFGTRITLPGLGTFTVHDRGGAIRERGDGVHRLDIWVGEGEEGLARALALGALRIEGTVYPVGTGQPRESVSLASLPAPRERLLPYLVAGSDLMSVHPKLGDRNLSSALLQERLRDVGYFRHAVTGFYGPATQESLRAFIRDFDLSDSPDALSAETAAFILAAAARGRARQPVDSFVDPRSSADAIAQAQRLLRFLGYYDGRTDGRYTDGLFAAILKFQQDNALVGTEQDPGAGRIGPLTQRRIRVRWNRELVRALAEGRYLALRMIDDAIAARGEHVEEYLGEGANGAQVRLLQRLLAAGGFFPPEEINGNFGPLTQQAVLAYQLARGIVRSAEDTGAGYVGPATMRTLRGERNREAYVKVRGEGWGAL